MKQGAAGQDNQCYACGKAFRKNTFGRIVFHPEVLTIDGQRQVVGYDCFKKVQEAREAGFQPPTGGPRLYVDLFAPPDVLKAAGITITHK